jgi:hypothetical protein
MEVGTPTALAYMHLTNRLVGSEFHSYMCDGTTSPTLTESLCELAEVSLLELHHKRERRAVRSFALGAPEPLRPANHSGLSGRLGVSISKFRLGTPHLSNSHTRA